MQSLLQLVQEFLQNVNALHPAVIYGIVLGLALLENLFPPAPSDIMIVCGGSLVAVGHVGFVETLLSATIGSTVGFMIVFKLGEWFGVSILDQGRLRFIKKETLHKVQSWFGRYGYWLIVANRFLSGTRAVISFGAGLSHLTLLRTTILSFFSALVWNAILVTAGYYLGRNWERIGSYLSTYSQLVTAIIVLAVLVVAGHYVYRTRKKNAGRRRD